MIILKRGYLFLGCLLFGVGACSSDSARFEQFIGRRITTHQEAYIFALKGIDELYVGRYDLENGAKSLPPVVSRTFIGQRDLNSAILGILPSGATFTVLNVQESVSSIGDIVTFRCRIDAGEFQGKILSTRFIQSNLNGRGGMVPVLDPMFATGPL